MESKKYRSLMVTPAFLEARRRKEKNEITNGRVLPPTSADVLRSTSNKYLVAATSLPPSRMRSIDFKEAKFKADHDAKSNMEENKHSPGKHLRSWKIPTRIMKEEVAKTASHSPPKAYISTITGNGKTYQEPNDSYEFRKKTARSFIERTDLGDYEVPQEWTGNFDKEETLIKEGILARPRKYSGTQEFKQIIHLARRSSDVTTVSGKSRMSYRPVKAKSANILHKTSSVAWRRDSTWLKPIRTSYQSWHGLPTYSLDTGISNAAALYMRPHKKTDSTFTIHPEWGCRA